MAFAHDKRGRGSSGHGVALFAGAVAAESANATNLQVTTQPVGSTSPNLATQPVVTAKKSFGTTDTSYVTNVVPVLNVLTGSATLGGTEASGKACVAGVCTFTNLTVTAASGATWTLTFTSGTLASATSSTGTTTAGGVSPAALLTHVTGGSTNGSGFTSSAIDTTGATFLVFGVSSATGTAPTISDSKGNTWTPLTIQANATDVQEQFYYCANPTVGAGHTFTIAGASTFPSLAVAAFSHVATSLPLLGQNGAKASAATSLQTGSLTPSADNAVLVTCCGVSTPAQAEAIDSGFTVIDTTQFGSGTHFGISLAYLVQTTAAAVNPTWSVASSTVLAATIAAFKNG